MNDPAPRVTLTFEPLPSAVPAAVRVRALLKHALRQLRLKCVGIAEVPAGEAPAAVPTRPTTS